MAANNEEDAPTIAAANSSCARRMPALGALAPGRERLVKKLESIGAVSEPEKAALRQVPMQVQGLADWKRLVALAEFEPTYLHLDSDLHPDAGETA